MSKIVRGLTAISRRSPFLFLGIFAGICYFFTADAVFSAESAVAKKAEIAWVKANGESFDIGYAFHDGSSWRDTFTLSTGNPVNFVPAIAKSSKNDTWLVWSSDTGEQYHLYYAVISNNNLLKGPFYITTGMSSSATPSIVLDDNDTPWLVFSGNNGGDDDIFFSRYSQNSWSRPERLHGENGTPDIFPQLEVEAGGAVTAQWTQFSSSGSSLISKTLAKGSSKQLQHISRKLLPSDLPQNISRCISSLPDNIDNLELATLQLNCEEASGSLQFIGRALEKKRQ